MYRTNGYGSLLVSQTLIKRKKARTYSAKKPIHFRTLWHAHIKIMSAFFTKKNNNNMKKKENRPHIPTNYLSYDVPYFSLRTNRTIKEKG